LRPTTATASPASTLKDTPAKAGWVARTNGWKYPRQPASAGGKYFSRLSTEIACEVMNSGYNRFIGGESRNVAMRKVRKFRFGM